VWTAIESALATFIEENGGSSPNDTQRLARSNLYGKAVRLAWHDAGETDIRTNDTMGPDGCLSNSSDNNGLVEDTSLVYTFIEPLWQVSEF